MLVLFPMRPAELENKQTIFATAHFFIVQEIIETI